MTFATADLYDVHGDTLRVALPVFRDFGGKDRFFGPAATVKCHEDNSLVRAALEELGEGRVLVIDGGASLRCALVGDMLAELGYKNGWQGIIVNGCIRDAEVMKTIDIGIKALGSNPRKSVKKGAGDRDIAVEIAGITVRPGDHVYADTDGIVVSKDSL